jgi:Arc/MetJ-type ribon-helix-helix transcriptional regulator
VSRSALIRRAIEAFMHDARKAEIDAEIVDAYTRMPQPEHDPWAEAAAIESIRAEPW